jgi:hypothetical protein
VAVLLQALPVGKEESVRSTTPRSSSMKRDEHKMVTGGDESTIM